MQPSISRSMWHRWSLDQCWPDMWKSLDMHMHINGRICMESYLEVVSFIINVSMHNQQRSPSVICICVFCRIWFWDTYLKMKDPEISDMNFHCAYPRFRVQWIWRLPHCKEWGEALHHRCWVFHLRVSTSSCINSFRWILYSTSGFGLSTSLVLLKSSYKFLQVPTSICSPMTFNVNVVW
jgi:hypothetical protein